VSEGEGDRTGKAGIREMSLEVLRTARVAVLGGEEGTTPSSTWFVLHGYRQLARRFARRFAGVAEARRRIVAPEALSRFYLAPGDRPHGQADPVGASWMTREDREAEIADYVRYLDRLARSLPGSAGAPPSGHRTVLGFSQGAHTAARWAVLGSVRCHRLVLWGAGLPGDLPEGGRERLAALELILVRGEDDDLRQADEEAREEALLAEWGIRWRELRHPGGHRIDGEVLQRLVAEEEAVRTPR